MTATTQGREQLEDDPTGDPERASADLLELRIALVCYGGVSLAIYMHGVTKELQSLLRASRAFDQAFASTSDADELHTSSHRPRGGTESAYFDQLVELARADVPVSVTIDVIAGTSAGGINGICLAKAAVRNASQDALTDLWMEKGDIAKLMRYGRFGGRLGGVLTALRLPGKARTTWSPLKGNDMSRWLFSALNEMTPVGSGSLLPPGGTLDLHVTATDVLGTDRIIPLGTGQSLHDHSYHRVFSFGYSPDGVDTIGEGDHGVLAFAARATSSFPGAFPPVTLDDFAAAVKRVSGGDAFDPAHAAAGHLPEYDFLPDVDARQVPMMDGGVLANAPFGPVVSSILAKPANRQVSRHLLYIEPDPRSASVGSTLAEVPTAGQRDRKPPSWAGTLRGAQTIRGHQSLSGAIQRLGELNDQVATIGDVIASLREDVEATLAHDVELDPDVAVDLSFQDLAAFAEKIYSSVPGIAGRLNYRVYGRLKMDRVSARLAEDLSALLTYPKTSPEASFLHAALLSWTRSCSAWSSEADGDIDEWLGGLDAPYRERRLEFLIDGINDLFKDETTERLGGRQASGPTRGQLSVAKDVAWTMLVNEKAKPAQAVSHLGAAADFASRSVLQGLVLTTDPRQWARDHDEDIERLLEAYRANLMAITANSAQELWEAFTETTGGWGTADARRRLASRYAGFPLWDALLFPAQSLSRLSTYNPIRVSRVSPIDATALTDTDSAATKLLGVSFAHFGAFFALERRENDYLWGRLDGAELILRLLREQYDSRRTARTTALEQSEQIQDAALEAVLDQEQPRLKEDLTQSRIDDLRATLSRAAPSEKPSAE